MVGRPSASCDGGTSPRWPSGSWSGTEEQEQTTRVSRRSNRHRSAISWANTARQWPAGAAVGLEPRDTRAGCREWSSSVARLFPKHSGVRPCAHYDGFRARLVPGLAEHIAVRSGSLATLLKWRKARRIQRVCATPRPSDSFTADFSVTLSFSRELSESRATACARASGRHFAELASLASLRAIKCHRAQPSSAVSCVYGVAGERSEGGSSGTECPTPLGTTARRVRVQVVAFIGCCALRVSTPLGLNFTKFVRDLVEGHTPEILAFSAPSIIYRAEEVRRQV